MVKATQQQPPPHTALQVGETSQLLGVAAPQAKVAPVTLPAAQAAALAMATSCYKVAAVMLQPACRQLFIPGWSWRRSGLLCQHRCAY